MISGALYAFYRNVLAGLDDAESHGHLNQSSSYQELQNMTPGENGNINGRVDEEAQSRLLKKGLRPEVILASKLAVNDYLNSRRKTDVTILGWLGWLYATVYTPVTQSLWLAENWTLASGQLKLVRGLGIAVSALSLTIDTRARYGVTLGKARFGGAWARVGFNIWTSGVALGLGLECALLLIKAVSDLHLPWYAVLIYCFFLVVWAGASFQLCPVRDGSIKGSGIIADVLMGAFAGLFLAAPAFAVYQTARFDDEAALMMGHGSGEQGQSLAAYLSCESVAGWQKFVAIFP